MDKETLEEMRYFTIPLGYIRGLQKEIGNNNDFDNVMDYFLAYQEAVEKAQKYLARFRSEIKAKFPEHKDEL